MSPYTDYYIWKDPKGWEDGKPIPPNNWESMFTYGEPGSAWEWNDRRQQFYFHAFRKEQPDLNFRNHKVIKEMKDILKFWILKGVAGFRVDAVPHLFEDEEMRDEPNGDHIYTQNLPETYNLVEEFRKFIDEYSAPFGADIFFTTEGYTTPEKTLRYYGSPSRPGAHFPFNFLLLTDFSAETNAHSLNRTIVDYLTSLEKHQLPNWVSGNHDWPRIPSRMGASSAVDQLNMLNLLLPGTSTLFMGDEIGMDCYWNLDKGKCPAGTGDDFRTPSRTPFQWSAKKNAGFTGADKPWLPINPEFYLINVEVENRRLPRYQGLSTHLQNFKELARIKSFPVFTEGKFSSYVLNDQVYAFTRGNQQYVYLILMNLSKRFSEPFKISEKIPEVLEIYNLNVNVQSVNLADECPNRMACVDAVFSGDWNMPPKSALVMSFKRNSRENTTKTLGTSQKRSVVESFNKKGDEPAFWMRDRSSSQRSFRSY